MSERKDRVYNPDPRRQGPVTASTPFFDDGRRRFDIRQSPPGAPAHVVSAVVAHNKDHKDVDSFGALIDALELQISTSPLTPEAVEKLEASLSTLYYARNEAMSRLEQDHGQS